MKPTQAKPTNRQLTALGISRSYASELVKGKKTPSLEVAAKIEAATGYPIAAWLEERAA